MPDSCLYITFTESQDVYFPGSVIEGIAHLVLDEPIKARTLTVGLDCRAHTSYDVSRSRTVTDSDGKSSSENYTESYSATTVYANVETIVWTSPPDGKEVMPAGTYQYPFAFKLPFDLPPSFEGSYGYIRHMVKMELDRPWRFNKRDKKAFTVLPTFDLNTIPEAILPVTEFKVKKLGIILFRHGEVAVECEIPKSGFVPGEMIVVNAHVINDSSKNIVKGKIKLLEVSNYVGYNVGKTIPQSPYLVNVRGDNHREQRRKIATGEQELCIPKNSEGNVQLYLQVPSTVASFNYCPIIKVEYVVELKFESTGSLNSNIETAVPVIIGTIPIREVISQEPTPTSSKIYPSLPEMDSPPPYSQENIQGDSLLPPFSYVESVKGIEGTVIDKYSMELYVPRYPFYSQLSEINKKAEGSDGKKPLDPL